MLHILASLLLLFPDFFITFIIGQVFLLYPPVNVDEGSILNVSFSMNRSKENHRLMEVEFDVNIGEPSGKMLPPINKKFYIE